MQRTTKVLCAVLCVVGLLGTSAASAATQTWNGASLGTINWSDGTNWSSGTAPSNGDNLIFPSIASGYTTYNDSLTEVGSVTFSSGTGTSSYSITGNPGSAPVLLDNGMTFAVNQNENWSIDTTWTTDQTFTMSVPNSAPGYQLFLNGALSGTGNLIKVGASGSVDLGGATSNTYNGNTWIKTGTTAITGDGLVLAKTSDGGATANGNTAVAVPGNLYLGDPTGGNNSSTNQIYVQCRYGNQLNPTGLLWFEDTKAHDFLLLGSDLSAISYAGTNQTVGGVSNVVNGVNTGLGVIEATQTTASTGTSTITIQPADGTNYSFNGFVRNTSTGSGTLAVTINGAGSGTQTLQGQYITYTGPTTISGGTLVLQDTTAFASSSVSNNAALTFKMAATSGCVYSAQLPDPAP